MLVSSRNINKAVAAAAAIKNYCSYSYSHSYYSYYYHFLEIICCCDYYYYYSVIIYYYYYKLFLELLLLPLCSARGFTRKWLFWAIQFPKTINYVKQETGRQADCVGRRRSLSEFWLDWRWKSAWGWCELWDRLRLRQPAPLLLPTFGVGHPLSSPLRLRTRCNKLTTKNQPEVLPTKKEPANWLTYDRVSEASHLAPSAHDRILLACAQFWSDSFCGREFWWGTGGGSSIWVGPHADQKSGPVSLQFGIPRRGAYQ